MGWPGIAAGCLLASLTSVAVAQAVVADVRQDGEVILLRASVEIPALPAAVWDVLTDYEGQARFVPGVSGGRVISRGSEGAVVYQAGVVKLLFLEFPFELEYATREQARTRLDSRLVRGSARQLRGTYRLTPSAAGTRLDYEGEIEPEGWLPPILGPWILRRELEARVGAMAQEVERRGRTGRR